MGCQPVSDLWGGNVHFIGGKRFSCLVTAMSKVDLIKSRPTRDETLFPPTLFFLVFFLFIPGANLCHTTEKLDWGERKRFAGFIQFIHVNHGRKLSVHARENPRRRWTTIPRSQSKRILVTRASRGALSPSIPRVW